MEEVGILLFNNVEVLEKYSTARCMYDRGK